MKAVNFISVIFLIIGGINWFFVGVFNINLLAVIFGHNTLVSRLYYTLIGLAALHLAFNLNKLFFPSKK
jgi:uncharacterized membrane protein YuzA (DUF378 family)